MTRRTTPPTAPRQKAPGPTPAAAHPNPQPTPPAAPGPDVAAAGDARPTRQPPATVVATPPRCRACQGTDLEVLKRLPDQDHHGHGTDGQPYTSISRQRVRCRACGTCQVLIRHHYDPRKWGKSIGRPA